MAAGNRALAVVLALIALTVLLGILLPQLPVGADQGDAAARWLAETSSRFGSLGGALRSAGLFDLVHSAWLRGVLGLLAFVLLLRLGLVLGDLHKRLRYIDPAAIASESRRWPLQSAFSLEGDVASALAGLNEDLCNEGWRVAASRIDAASQPWSKTDASVVLAAERSVRGLWSEPLIILGALVILVGLWLGQLVGWRETNVTLVPGQPVQLSRNGMSLLATTSGGPGTSGVDAVTAQPAGGQAITKPLPSARAAHLAGVTIRRTGEGQALTVSAQDSAGRPVSFQRLEDQGAGVQTELNLVFDRPRAEQVLLAPARQLVVSIVAFPALPERGFSGPTFLVQAFEVGRRDPIYNQFIEAAATSIKATLIIGGIQGFLGGMIFFIAGIRGAPLWGIIMMFMSVFPVLGREELTKLRRRSPRGPRRAPAPGHPAGAGRGSLGHLRSFHRRHLCLSGWWPGTRPGAHRGARGPRAGSC